MSVHFCYLSFYNIISNLRQDIIPRKFSTNNNQINTSYMEEVTLLANALEIKLKVYPIEKSPFV